MSPIHDHFDEVTGLLYLDGQLDAGQAREVAAHLASCAECSRLLHALGKESVWLRDALVAQEEPVPARLAAPPGRAANQWGWVAVFGLAVVGAYTLWTSYVQPGITQAEQAGFTQRNLLTMLFFGGAFWKGWDAMRSSMELLAAGTLGLAAFWLLRKQWRHFVAIAAVMAAMAVALALPAPAGAGEVKHGNPNYTLAAGQEVKTDLIVAATRTRIDGDVDGDLIVFSSSVTVNGHIKGDILGFAQELIVNGPVDGNVRTFSQSLAINRSVGKNVSSWAQQVDLDEKSAVGGSVTLFAQNADLDGQVGGDLLALTQMLDLNGSVGGNAQVRGDRLVIGPQAEIKGTARYQGRRQPEISPAAKMGSPMQMTMVRRGPDYTTFRYYWRQVLAWGASFIFGLVLLLIAPAFYSDVVARCNKALPAIGLGILFLVGLPVVAVLACVTIVGLGLGIASLLLYVVGLYSTQVFVGSWLGEKLLGAGAGSGPAMARLALGLAALRILTMLPFVGPLADFVIVIWGLGALALVFYKNVHAAASAAAAAA